MGEAVILPKDRDPRFITVRRGGTLQDSDHRLLAEWAADCAEHVLHFFEVVQPADARPRQAIEQARAWVRGEVTMTQARAAAFKANAAARDLTGAARYAAYAAGQAAAVAHVAAHELGAAATRSRRHALLRQTTSVNAPVGRNVSGSAGSCRTRSAILCWMTKGCETGSAGRCSTASPPFGPRPLPGTRRFAASRLR